MPSEANLVALSRHRLACVFRGLSCASPGTRFSSELDLQVGGRDRWTGWPRPRGTLLKVPHGFLVVVGPAKSLGLGFAGLLRSLGQGSYSLPMVPGSVGSAGSGV